MSDFEPMDLPKPKGTNRYLIIGLVTLLAIMALVTVIENANRDARVNQLSSPCFDAMEKASLEPDSTLAEPLLKETASACSGRSEWMAALEEYPEAMGFTIAYPDSIDTLCLNYRNSRTCLNP